MSIPQKLAGLSMSIDMIVCLFVAVHREPNSSSSVKLIIRKSPIRLFVGLFVLFCFVSATAASFWSLSQTDSRTGTTKGQKTTSRHHRGPRLKDDDNCTPQVRRDVGLPNSVRIRRSRYYLQCASNEHVRNPSKLSIDRSREIASLKSILLHSCEEWWEEEEHVFAGWWRSPRRMLWEDARGGRDWSCAVCFSNSAFIVIEIVID